jgi:arabinan endo-1,5-alpha-L-arabinosidase
VAHTPHQFLTLAAAILLAANAASREPALLVLDGDTERVHDPAIIQEKDTYYIFCTGRAPGGAGIIPIRTSKDLHHWTLSGAVLDKLPEWSVQEVPGARDAWAPDISFYDGKFHLYYAVSTFGRNGSAIGLATNATLDPSRPDYRWEDQGMVVRSTPGVDDFNAIDPNLAVEDRDHVWLSWGSFWGGIKLRRIDPATGKLSDRDSTTYSLCARPRTNPDISRAGDGAVEAPFLVRRQDYWYLFVSYDYCCRGARSNYKVVVGRSRKITGPYLDQAGKPLLEGGGSLVVEAQTAKWHGAGHQAILQEKDRDYLVFHAYDAASGRPSLAIAVMEWENGWPKPVTMP